MFYKHTLYSLQCLSEIEVVVLLIVVQWFSKEGARESFGSPTKTWSEKPPKHTEHKAKLKQKQQLWVL